MEKLILKRIIILEFRKFIQNKLDKIGLNDNHEHQRFLIQDRLK